ncbi:biopolymer transporter ExbD [Dyadobacter sp. CY261]|uniref:ExbD/TolR family protein n=1 Tax=Dyadobacter sp. CY261 TaxID=2907203 RepID=UPI001F1580C9|nr:biopolymer transporter ExbD [Dyadobacter sp. CY261]MCF0071429.1 biopolymer transporter ExbD [Dyadobacter sp. CY261]
MKIRRKSRFAPEVFTHSLNDIMFFLLLFFLIISTMSNPNVIKLMLPKASATQQMYKKQITLSIDDKKAYFIDKEPIPFDRLEAELQNIFANVEERTIVLRVDKNLAVQDLVDVLELGAKNDIKMVMATAK